jgi:hypothetical protein
MHPLPIPGREQAEVAMTMIPAETFSPGYEGHPVWALVLCHRLILGCMRVNSFRFSRCFS